MSIWNIFGKFAYSDDGEVIQKLSGNTSISSNGTTYHTAGPTTMGSDGSMFTQMGSFSSDGSVRMGSMADGLGAVFNRDGSCGGMGGAFGPQNDCGWNEDGF